VAWVVSTNTGVADPAFGAQHTVAGVAYALAIVAELSGRALDIFAGAAGFGVVLAASIDADLGVTAFDICAGGYALPFAAELMRWAGVVGAWVFLTFAVDAALTGGAAFEIAIITHALTLRTLERRLTSDEITGIDAALTEADLAVWTLDIGTGFTNAQAVDALESALTFATATWLAAFTFLAYCTHRTDGVVVGITVAIIIFAVADLRLWQGCVAIFPLAIVAGFSAGATCCFAGANQIIIDQAIAIVIFAVADLRFGLGARASAPLAIDAVCNTFTTSTAARFRRQIIDLAVAIVIFAVADLRFGERGIAESPLTAHTDLFAFATDGLTGPGEVIIY
jgi:hypothetical protein